MLFIYLYTVWLRDACLEMYPLEIVKQKQK